MKGKAGSMETKFNIKPSSFKKLKSFKDFVLNTALLVIKKDIDQNIIYFYTVLLLRSKPITSRFVHQKIFVLCNLISEKQ